MYDAIIVPGGGVRPDGSLLPWVRERFDRVLEIRASEPVLCLSAGTVHKPPPLDAEGRPVFEAIAGARYLLSRGIEPASILIETASWDTVGSAYFARVMHAEVRGWRRLLVVNSKFHMPRTELIFRWVFAVAPDRQYSLDFETVPDTDFPPADLEYRRHHESARLANARGLSDRICSLAGLHAFMFQEHDAYSAAGLLKPRAPAPLELARVY